MNILDQELLLLTDAVKLLPRRPHVSTVWRWTERGVRGIRLETWLIGGHRYTSREALEAFIQQTNASNDKSLKSTSKQREAAILAAEKALEREGVF